MKNSIELTKIEVNNVNCIESKGSFSYSHGGVSLTVGECDPVNEVQVGSWRLSIVESQELYVCHEDLQDHWMALEWATSDYNCERRTQISGLKNNPHEIQRLSEGTVLIRHGDDKLEINVTNSGVVIINVR